MENKQSITKQEWKPLKEIAPHTQYAVGYLSLMARRGKLKVKKINGVWWSTINNVKTFENEMNSRKEDRRKQLSSKYHSKTKKTKKVHTVKPKKVESKVNNNFKDTIFNEVQKDLEDVLKEIRDKEKRIREEYVTYRAKKKQGTDKIGKNTEKKKEAVTEKLIEDLGKLLNTANQVYKKNDNKEAGEEKIDEFLIPIKNRTQAADTARSNGLKITKRTNKLSDIYYKNDLISKNKDFLSVVERNIQPQKKESNAANRLLIIACGLLAFVVALMAIYLLFE